LRKITVTLDDNTFESLINYTADKSKREMNKMNLSDTVRELLSEVLSTPELEAP
jgi:hypothetical protein